MLLLCNAIAKQCYCWAMLILSNALVAKTTTIATISVIDAIASIATIAKISKTSEIASVATT